MYSYQLRLLDPLFYRTRQDSGAAGSTTTDPWIGDLALSYAINRALGIIDIKFGYGSNRPNYHELRSLPLITSVAVPSERVRRTQVYDIATNFMSEGYTNVKALKLTENAPMRNWLKRQGLSPGNQFTFSMAVDRTFVPPKRFTVRLGNTLECLAVCDRMEEVEDQVTANAYTLKALFGLDEGNHLEFDRMERPLAQYVLLHGVPSTNWVGLVSPLS